MSDERSANSHRADELLDLFVRIWGDDFAPEEFSRLEEILRNDPAARRRYYEFVELHGDLSWTFGRLEATSPADDEPPAKLPPAKPTPDKRPAEKPAGTTVLGFLGGVVDYLNQSRRLMMVLLVAVGLCGWLAFRFGSGLVGGNGPVADQPGSNVPGQKPEKRLASGLAPPHDKALAWLSGSVDAHWQVVAVKPATGQPAEPAFWEIDTEFAPSQQVNLVSGRGEITFRSGAKIILTAPAQFAVTSALGTDLQVGKLTARVPHEPSTLVPSSQGPSTHAPSTLDPSQNSATGFTVTTPAGSVVDLGTEFGVAVSADHKMDVQVFVGAVRVNSSSAEGALAAAGVTVSAGHAVHVEAGAPANVVESQDQDRFPRDLITSSDSINKQRTAYLERVRRLKPVVWLRMEGNDGDRTLHDDAGNADAKLFWTGEGNPFVSGAIGKSLWLRGPEFKDYAILADYPKAQHDKLTVAAWVYADSRPNFATIAKNWRYANGRGQFHFGLVSPIKLQDPSFQPDSIDLGVEIAQRNGQTVSLREGESHPFPLNQWQHVAFVADGVTVRLYREGREVAAADCVGLRYPVGIKSLGIGVKTDDSGQVPDKAFPDYWSGRLDEIAIFNEALTAEEIQSLAAAPPR